MITKTIQTKKSWMATLRVFAVGIAAFGMLSGTANAALTANGMASNGMASNGMASNGMASNGMASNGMASNGMASNGMASNGMASNGMASNGAPAPASLWIAAGIDPSKSLATGIAGK